MDIALATAALSQLPAPAVAAGRVNLVIGFGSDLWRADASGDAPNDLRLFTPISRLGGARAPLSGWR